MPREKGYSNVSGMRHKRKGGNYESRPDGFNRASSDTLASLVDAWINKQEVLAYSPRTLDMNYWALKSFLGWCGERTLVKPEEITKPMLESFQRWLFRYRKKNGKPLGVSTQRNRLGAVQRFFAWLCRENVISANPAADLELPRKPAKLLPKALSREEILALFAIPNPSDLLGLRDRCILEVFYSCGLRRMELINLNVEDLDTEREVVTVVKGKGGKSRTVPVGECAMKFLQNYLEEGRPRLELDHCEKALFLTGYGERFSAGYLTHWVGKALKKAGVLKTGSCHLLRHSCATHMLENGADVRFIQQLLGHANLGTTSIYTEVSIGRLQEVHKRTHPRGKV